MKLKFEDLDLERSSYSCDRQSTNVIDFVKIGNGQDSESKQIAFYCGYESFYSGFPEVHSTGRYMWIKFYSNSPQHWINEKGFKARFEAVDICKYCPFVRSLFVFRGDEAWWPNG